jgi:hypothetical protein
MVVAFDTAANIFPGNENDRTQARQFLGTLCGLTTAADALSHGRASEPTQHQRRRYLLPELDRLVQQRPVPQLRQAAQQDRRGDSPVEPCGEAAPKVTKTYP